MERNDKNHKADDILKRLIWGRRTFLKGLTVFGLGGLGAGLSRPISGMAAESSTMQKKGKFLVEPSRKVPIVREVDILVVGGGMAGITAALAAGRMGLKTLLVDYYGSLGGNATIGLVNTFCGFYTKENLVPVVKGVGGEIVQTMIDQKAAQAKGWYLPFDSETLKLILDEKAAEAKVELLYYTQMVDPIVEKNTIKGVVVANKGGRQAILAKRVLDCTGDGDVCASANVPFELGDGKGGFLSADMAFQIVNVGKEFDPENYRKVVIPAAAEAIKSGEYKLMTRADCYILYVQVPGVYEVNMAGIPWVVNGVDPYHLTQATIDGRKVIRDIQRFFRDKIPGLDKVDVVQTAPKIGLRETRRVMGEHLLTGEEVSQAKKFDDGIGAGAWPFEIVTAQERKYIFLKGDSFYTIPYRCLVPKKIENLLMAGRYVSCTHEAQASLRVMGPAAVMGHAVGTAAALSIKEKVSPRKLNVKLLQKELEKTGAFLG
jgi:hypothetical protein